MTHKTEPEQAVGVNEGNAVAIGVSVLRNYEGTPIRR